MKKILTVLAISGLFIAPAKAKWWIFGKARQPVKIKYLYINNSPSDETGGKLTLFKNSLVNGMIVVRGKAKAAKGGIGSVRISLDGKETWKDAKFSPDGSFEFKFRPETGKRYEFYVEAMDTSGKTNKVDETKIILSVSEKSPYEEVRKVLDAMIDAYNGENAKKFMEYVSEDFTGDKAFLERAVRDDFNALSNIRLRYTVNNIAASAGKIMVSVKYNRMVFVNKTGNSNTDSGNTEFVFKNEKGGLRLYSMKRPLIFGLSDAANVAAGSVAGEEAGLSLDSGGSLSVTVSATKAADGNDMLSYNFSENMTYSETSQPGTGSQLVNGDIAFNGGHFIDSSARNVQIAETGGKDIDSLSASEAAGLSYQDDVLKFNITGYTYAVRVNGKYYAIKFISFTGDGLTPPYTATFKVKSF